MGDDTQTEIEYKSEGETINKALDALDLDYTKISQKGTLHLTDGKKKSSKFFYVPQLRRVIVSKLRKSQVARDLEYLLE